MFFNRWFVVIIPNTNGRLDIGCTAVAEKANAKLKKMLIPHDQIPDHKDRVNLISNLQLLEAIPNIEKSDKPFDKWLSETYNAESEIKTYLKKKCTNFSSNISKEENNRINGVILPTGWKK